jgi:hypothetical protein
VWIIIGRLVNLWMIWSGGTTSTTTKKLYNERHKHNKLWQVTSNFDDRPFKKWKPGCVPPLKSPPSIWIRAIAVLQFHLSPQLKVPAVHMQTSVQTKSRRDLKIPGPAWVWFRKPELGQKNAALLSELHFNSKLRSMQSQGYNCRGTYNHA